MTKSKTTPRAREQLPTADEQLPTADDGTLRGLRSGRRRSPNNLRGEALQAQQVALEVQAHDMRCAAHAAVVLQDARLALRGVLKGCTDPALTEVLGVALDALACEPPETSSDATRAGWECASAVLAHEVLNGPRERGAKGLAVVDKVFVGRWLEFAASIAAGEAPALDAISHVVKPATFLKDRQRKGGVAGREMSRRIPPKLLADLVEFCAPKR